MDMFACISYQPVCSRHIDGIGTCLPCYHCLYRLYLRGLTCLMDTPEDPNWPALEQPFGKSWSIDEQCRQEFGVGFKACDAVSTKRSSQPLVDK